MKSRQKTPFTYGSIPHSVLKRAQEIKNPTASSLLLYLASRTFAFRRPSIVLTYRELAEAINCCWRSVATAGQKLEEWGDLIRTPQTDGRYCWTLVLDAGEVISDPAQAFAVRQDPVLTPPPCKIDHGGHARSIMGGMQDLAWGPADDDQGSKPVPAKVLDSPRPPQKEPLKKVFKERDLKKQHVPAASEAPTPSPAPPELDAPRTDESLHKFLIRSLRSHGVSQRKARQLCREHDHNVIQQVLETAPKRPEIKNLPAYIVTEIQDGGYDTPVQKTKKVPGLSCPRNYAHLTDQRLNEQRHKTVKPSDCPKTSPDPEQTQREQQDLAAQKQEKATNYNRQLKTLLERYKTLSQDLQTGIQQAARAHLEAMIPAVSRRDQMAQDQMFKTVAIKSTLERFFELVDEGLSGHQALRSAVMLGSR